MPSEAFILTLFSLTVTFATEPHAAMDRLKEASDINSFAKCNPFNVQAKGITSCVEYFLASSVNLEACDLNLGWHDICVGAVPEGKGSLREICPRECGRKVLYPELEDDDALVVQHFVDLLRTTVEMYPEPRVDASAGEDESVAPETSVSSEDSRSIGSLDEDEFGRRRLLPRCVGNHLIWNAGFGPCTDYVVGGSDHSWCNIDKSGGLTASEVCVECGACHRDMPSDGDLYWVDDGCHSEGAPDPHDDDVRGSFNKPSSLAGVRCCDAAGTSCVTFGSCPGFHTYSQAAALCESNGYRLCTKAELHTEICCGTGGMCDHHPVWTSTRWVPEPYSLAFSSDDGKFSGCRHLKCQKTSGLDECKTLCDSYDECNVLNFCPAGHRPASCKNYGYRGMCCARDCHSIDQLYLQYHLGGWDVYTKE